MQWKTGFQCFIFNPFFNPQLKSKRNILWNSELYWVAKDRGQGMKKGLKMYSAFESGFLAVCDFICWILYAKKSFIFFSLAFGKENAQKIEKVN
jgi:hypothetical protein